MITRDFVVLSALVFVSYCNIAVFFQFHDYLETLPIAPEWFGLLIGLFSVVVLILRPIISPFLHAANARKWIAISTCIVIVSLVLYNFAHDLWTMAAVRCIHGVGYVIMATAVIARLVDSIPEDKSGQAFGLLSVLTLLPYAVIPPVLSPLIHWAGGFDHLLLLSGVFMPACFPILGLVEQHGHGESSRAGDRIGWSDLTENLTDWRIWVVLIQGLLLWSSFTPMFFFLKGFGDEINVANAGFFFTLSTSMEMGVRLVAGRLFDKLHKGRLLAVSLAWLAVGYLMIGHTRGESAFYALGIFFGIGWGVAMPVLSGLTFELSQPRFRALNTNLSMEMFQAGFFVGPLIGGFVLTGWGYPAMFHSCGAMLVMAFAAAIPLLGGRGRKRGA